MPKRLQSVGDAEHVGVSGPLSRRGERSVGKGIKDSRHEYRGRAGRRKGEGKWRLFGKGAASKEVDQSMAELVMVNWAPHASDTIYSMELECLCRASE
jgi:hypothetical protein